MSNSCSQQGLTLIELVVTIVILSIAMVTVSQMLSTGFSRSADTLIELRTASLAKAYMDEILGKRFDEKSASNGVPPCRDPALGGPVNRHCTLESAFGPEDPPGPTPLETRPYFNDVDDYTNIDEGEGPGVLNALQDAEGNTRTGYEGFRVVIDVRYVDIADEELGLGQNNELDDNYDAKLITVTISHALLPIPYVYSAYKSNF